MFGLLNSETNMMNCIRRLIFYCIRWICYCCVLLSIFCQIIYFVTCAKIRKVKKNLIFILMAHHYRVGHYYAKYTNGASIRSAPLVCQSTWLNMAPGRHTNGALCSDAPLVWILGFFLLFVFLHRLQNILFSSTQQ